MGSHQPDVNCSGKLQQERDSSEQIVKGLLGLFHFLEQTSLEFQVGDILQKEEPCAFL